MLAVEMEGDLIMTSLKLQKWPKLTIAHHLKMQTLIIYKLITLLPAERVLVARERQQVKGLVVVMRTD